MAWGKTESREYSSKTGRNCSNGRSLWYQIFLVLLLLWTIFKSLWCRHARLKALKFTLKHADTSELTAFGKVIILSNLHFKAIAELFHVLSNQRQLMFYRPALFPPVTRKGEHSSNQIETILGFLTVLKRWMLNKNLTTRKFMLVHLLVDAVAPDHP